MRGTVEQLVRGMVRTAGERDGQNKWRLEHMVQLDVERLFGTAGDRYGQPSLQVVRLDQLVVN